MWSNKHCDNLQLYSEAVGQADNTFEQTLDFHGEIMHVSTNMALM